MNTPGERWSCHVEPREEQVPGKVQAPFHSGVHGLGLGGAVSEQVVPPEAEGAQRAGFKGWLSSKGGA